MKVTTLIASAAIAVSATAATAGGLAPAVMEVEPVVIMDSGPTSSLGQFIVPAILLGLIALGASASSDSESTTAE